MSDLLFKLRMLRVFLCEAFDNWRTEIWRRDLDGTYCCDGRECGCQGSTVRDVYSWQMRPQLTSRLRSDAP